MDEQRLIDADALKRYISLGYMRSPTEKCFSELDVIKMIDAQDAIEERKTGKWIELTNTNHTYVCSVCGRMLVNITDGKNKVAEHYPFCHCGARMVQEGEEQS